MNKKVLSILFVLLFLVFIGIMDYPFLAQLLNERNQTAAATAYQESAENLSEAEREQYFEAARAYNRTLSAGVVMNLEAPFVNTEVQDAAYQEILALQGTEALGVLEIPEIDLAVPVYHGTSDAVLEKGAGHLEGSSFPVGGAGTHACIAAHRGLPTKRLFTDLDQIGPGDLFYMRVLGETLAYQVYEVEVVEPDNADSLVITEGQDIVTLITCTPYGINSHRIYVHGRRIPYEETAEGAAFSLESFWKTWWWAVVTVLLLVWMCVLLCWFNRRPGQPENSQSG